MAAKKKTSKKSVTKSKAPAKTNSAPKAAAAKASAPKARASKAAPAKAASAPKAAAAKSQINWPEVALSDNNSPLRAEDAYEIGRIISEHFEGSLSLREIGEQEQLRLSPGALHRCLAVYRVCTNLGTKPNWEHLGFSHLNRLDALNPQQQKKVAAQAEKQQWSVDRIEREVTRLRQTSKKTQRRGRPALPRFAKAAHQLRRFTDGRDDLLGDLDSVGEYDRNRVKEILTQVSEVREQLEKLEQALKRAK